MNAYRFFVLAMVAASALSWSNLRVHGQTVFGIDDTGLLFKFEAATPSSVTEIGNVGFVPRGIDFRPSSNILYGLSVGPVNAQLYTIDTNTALPTPVGASFPSVIAGSYDISSIETTLGFDFNPTTLQPDTSMRIRVVGSNGVNLRLNSLTGQIAVVDTPLTVSPSGGAPQVDAVAYINNYIALGNTTSLFDLDVLSDSLYIQNPPNAGVLTSVGPLGVTINGLADMSFDIFSNPDIIDPTLVGDTGYAVLRRPDAPINGILGSYMFYNVNLGTGQLTQGAIVGPSNSPYSFEGGMAIRPVPEPSSLLLVTVGGFLACYRRRHSSRSLA